MSFSKILFSAVLLTYSFIGFAQQSTTISGYVRDSTYLVPGASVFLKNTKTGTITDAKGHYELNNVNPGKYTIVISFLGFLTEAREINVKSGQQLSINFTLKKNLQELDLVAIKGKTTTREIRETGFAVNALEVKKFANVTADLNQILNRSTGVKIREQGGLGSSFNFSINGLSGKQVRFFIDGVPMESFGSAMSLNNIPVNLAERIEVYKGVVPIELGADALGGAVNIITDQHTKKFLDASYSYGSFNTSRAAVNSRFTDEKTGLVFNINGFHNYSDNDYLMRNNPKYDAPINVIENGNIVEKDIRRFNDAYRSTMGQMEIGLVDKSWTDRLTVGFIYSSLYKEIQNGASQNKVFGALNNRASTYMPTLKYKKDNFLLKGLSANVMASFAIDKSQVTDTSTSLYGWGGKVRPELIAGELGDIKTIYHYKNNSGIIRANFGYKIDDQQSLNLNYTYTHFGRTAREDLGKAKNNTFDIPNTIDKNIIGLAYQNNMLDNKLSATAFLKYYGYGAFVRDATYLNPELGWVKKNSSTHKDYFGYGFATRFKFTDQAGIKASYEHAYRLQEGEELFGNGINVSANTKLKPEQSDNVNLGLYYNHQQNDHNLAVDAAVFYRDAKDFIYFIPTGGIFSSYDNVGKTKINGIEGEIRYNYKQLAEVSVNASYQNSKNNRRYQDKAQQVQDPTYGDRIPNQPWIYGNGNINIGQNNLIGKDSRLQFNWSTQYVHYFYLTWTSLGSKESRNQIPQQWVHNTSLAYSFKGGKYNLSAESFNVTNQLIYDNFRLQKPGRSFSMKLRYFIK